MCVSPLARPSSPPVGGPDPAILTAIGSLECLQPRVLALLCSIRCPGSVILRTYDLAVALRDAGVPVIAGFHAPMEQECLRLLLRGAQPVIICPARGIQRMRLLPAWRQPIEQGRLLVLSPFTEQECRMTRDLAERRNQFVASLADQVLVAHAVPGGKTERICQHIIAPSKPSLTLGCPENAHPPRPRRPPPHRRNAATLARCPSLLTPAHL